MKRRNVTKTIAAEADIREIFATIGFDSLRAAQKFNSELAAALERLSEFPQMGHGIAGDHTPLWAMRVSSRFRRYLVIYRLLGDDGLEVVRVLDGTRDTQAVLAASK